MKSEWMLKNAKEETVYIILHKGYKKVNVVKVFSNIEMAREYTEEKNENWWIEEHYLIKEI